MQLSRALLLMSAGMQDPNMDNQTVEELLTMQLTRAMKALRDPVPTVREAAVSGNCGMLSTWWELLPAQAITKLMVLLQGSAFDGAAPRVRTALLVGLKDLVNNPLVRCLPDLLCARRCWSASKTSCTTSSCAASLRLPTWARCARSGPQHCTKPVPHNPALQWYLTTQPSNGRGGVALPWSGTPVGHRCSQPCRTPKCRSTALPPWAALPKCPQKRPIHHCAGVATGATGDGRHAAQPAAPPL